jgi:formiminoglutamase
MSSPWPHLAELLRPAGTAAEVALLGAPLATGSVTPGRCDLAPAALRFILKRIGRYDLDCARELRTLIADLGDVELAGLPLEEAGEPLREAVRIAVAEHRLTLLVGGNNAVTRPGLLGMAAALELPLASVGLLTLDAHLDMRGLEQGLSNGNPVRALLADGLPGSNIAQIGLLPFANSREMHEDALVGGHHLVSMSGLEENGLEPTLEGALQRLAHCAALYVDCDIDVIDRAEMPGAPGARPGGMPAGVFFRAVRRLAAEPRVRMIDLTEWDPPLDPSDLSALTAGRWLAEVLAGFEAR